MSKTVVIFIPIFKPVSNFIYEIIEKNDGVSRTHRWSSFINNIIGVFTRKQQTYRALLN